MIGLVVLVLVQAAAPTARQQFDTAVARAAEARKAGRDADALRFYQQAVKLRHSWADGWWNLGSIHYERDEFPEARDALEKLVALDKKAVAGFALLGICDYKVEKYDAALQHLDAARTLGLPHNHPLGNAAFYYLAALLNREGRHDIAAELLLVAPESQLESPAVQVAIGMTGLRIAKLPEDLTPSERDLCEKAGRAMSDRRDAEAAASMHALLEQHPDRPNMHYLYGIVLLRGDSTAAIQQFQEELKRDPRHVPSLLAIVRELERQSRFEEGLAYAQRAVEAQPENYATHAILGRVLVSLDRAAEGASELERAKEIEPGSPQIYFALASAYTKLGRPDDAAKARAEFLRLKDLGK